MRALDSGEAAERFGRMVAAQGGPADFVPRYERYLPVATLSKPVFPGGAGYIRSMDTRALGMAVVALGGGRQLASDAIDYSVGLNEMARLGDYVDAKTPLAVVHAASEESWLRAAEAVRAAIQLGDVAPQALPVVYRRITAAAD